MNDQPAKPGSEGTISAETAARLIDATPRWVRKLVELGYVTKPTDRGRYNLTSVVRGYIKYLKDEGRRTSKSAADSRVRDARAAEIELKVATAKRELIPIEDAQVAFDFFTQAVSEAIRAIPARATRGDLELRRKLETECNAALSQIAEALRKSLHAARTGSDPTDPGAGNNAG